MGVVQLDADFLSEIRPLKFSVGLFSMAFVTADDILKSCTDQQILLLESQLFSSFS